MNTRLLSLLLAFALLINFSGIHALAAEMSRATSEISAVKSHAVSTKTHSHCAMHTHSETSTLDHAWHKYAKKSHVCGSLECDCGCHMSALTFAIIGIAGVSHAAKLAMFQAQRSPLPPVKMSLRPPILA